MATTGAVGISPDARFASEPRAPAPPDRNLSSDAIRALLALLFAAREYLQSLPTCPIGGWHYANVAGLPESFLSMLPLELRRVLESGKGILFVGAGIGFNARGKSGLRMPTASELATELAATFKIETEGSTDLTKVAQIVELRAGRKELNSFLSGRL